MHADTAYAIIVKHNPIILPRGFSTILQPRVQYPGSVLRILHLWIGILTGMCVAPSPMAYRVYGS